MKTQFLNSHASSNSNSEDISNLQIRKPTVSKRHALRIILVGGGGWWKRSESRRTQLIQNRSILMEISCG